MSKPSFPWPKGTLTNPIWRNRHVRTGDTTPPSRVQGEPSATKCVPYTETGPTGHYGGFYQSDSRAIGLGEPPIASVINRAIYDISCSLDMIYEAYDADLSYFEIAGATAPGPGNQIDLRAASMNFAMYLGKGTTTTTAGPDPKEWCSNFVKLRLDQEHCPFILSTTGHVTEVADILSEPAGGSMYAPGVMPAITDVYPYGTPGVISIIVHGGGLDDRVQFDGGVRPSGLNAAPAADVALFNYSLYERRLVDPASLDDCFAICTASVNLPPEQFTVNRDDLAAKGWLTGDYLYTTHFAWCPTLVMNDTIATPIDVALWCGRMRLSAFSGPDISRFMDFLRWLDAPAAYRGLAPFVVEESPSAAIQRCFDYANALIRAQDGSLLGTIGFDFSGSSDHPTVGGGPGVPEDSYSGYMHRKLMVFDSAANTRIDFDEPVTWDAAGNVTITAAPGARWLRGAAAVNTLLIPGIDLMELTDAAGDKLALLVLNTITNASVFTARELDGTIWAPGAGGAGTLRIYRPQFRTGIWDSSGTLTGFRGGSLFVGDNFAGQSYPAVTAVSISPGATFGDDLYQGYSSWMTRDMGAGLVTEAQTLRYRVGASGSVEFSGLASAGNTYRGSMSGGIDAGICWKPNTESWSTYLRAIDDTGATKAWRQRCAVFHFIEGNDTDDATYLQLSTNELPNTELGSSDHAGIWMGLPGDVYPRPNIIHTAGGAADHRDAGYLFSYNSAGWMEVHVGLTSNDNDLFREFVLRESPSVRDPPATQFGANRARVEMDAHTSIGWSVDVPFYTFVAMSDGYPDATNAPSTWSFYAGLGDAPYWYDPTHAGDATEADTAIVFRLNLPHNARLDTIDLKYKLVTSDHNAFTGRGIKLCTYKEDPNWAGVHGAMAALGAVVESPKVEGEDTLTFTAAPGTIIDNQTYQYFIIVTAAYDDRGGGAKLDYRWLYAIMATYWTADLLPA